MAARGFLSRCGWREPDRGDRLSTDDLRAPDPSGQLVAAPIELVVCWRRFATRFGGLRYMVRRCVGLGGQRVDTIRRRDFDADGWIRREPAGWSFGWTGEHVSSPVRYLVHTDGRFGVTLGGPFLEVRPSIHRKPRSPTARTRSVRAI
jgi:hypothetical protein